MSISSTYTSKAYVSQLFRRGLKMNWTIARRVFIAGLATLPAIPRLRAASSNRLDLIIVGAGAAGIAAAGEARRMGLSAIILEARSRVGGRAVTDESSLGLPFDLGAGFLHSAKINPVFALAKSSRISSQTSNRDDLEFREAGHISPLSTLASFKDAEVQLTKAIMAVAASGRDISLAAAADDPWTRRLADLLAAVDFNGPPERLSVLDIARLSDGRDRYLSRGLGHFVGSLVSDLNIRLETIVRQIDSSASGVTVSGDFGSLNARGCIVTVPTSLLASGEMRFIPELPAALSDAIVSLPLGLMLKIGYRLDRRIASSEWVVANSQINAGRPNAIRLDPHAPLATVFTGAQPAWDISRDGLAAKLAFGRAVLADAFGSRATASIVRETATAWDTDPWARGAYSYALPGQSKARDIYATPIEGKLIFAGEAGGGDLAQTIGGAWRSGYNATKTLAKQFKNSR